MLQTKYNEGVLGVCWLTLTAMMGYLLYGIGAWSIDMVAILLSIMCRTRLRVDQVDIPLMGDKRQTNEPCTICNPSCNGDLIFESVLNWFTCVSILVIKWFCHWKHTQKNPTHTITQTEHTNNPHSTKQKKYNIKTICTNTYLTKMKQDNQAILW